MPEQSVEPVHSRVGLRYVDSHKDRGLVYRAWARSVATPFGFWLSRHIAWKVDPISCV